MGAPLILIISLTFNKLIFIRLIFRLIVGSVGNINELRVFIMYTYSSISHTGWLIVSSIINEHVCMLYLIIYSIILLTVILYIIKELINIRSLLILSILIITRILLIYIYLRLTLIIFIKTNFKKLFIINNKHNIFITFISIINLPILLIIY